MCCTQVRHHSHWGADIRAFLALSLSKNVITHPIRVHVPSPWHGLGETAVLRLVRARETSAAPPNSTRAGCASYRQHVQHREASSSVTHLEHGDRVVRQKEWICRFRSHLHAKQERQFEISAVCKKSTPPQSQSVRAGVLRWVLEQGECSRSCGQQLIVRGAARRTVD